MKTRKFSKKKQARIDRAVRLADVRRILEDMELKYGEKRRGDLWYRCTLPSHKDSDASAHICSDPASPHHGVWHCFGCDASGSVISLVQTQLNLSFWEAVLWVEYRLGEAVDVRVAGTRIKKVELPKTYECPDYLQDWNGIYTKYLTDRDITFEQIKKHEIGYCDRGKLKKRIVIPVKLYGVLRTWIARSIVGDKPRATSCPNGLPGLFGSDFADPIRGPAVVVEGWADALKLERMGYNNVVSLQTNIIHEDQWRFLRHFPYIILVPDGDEGGDHLVDTCSQYVEERPFYVAHLPRGQDPDETPVALLEDAIQRAVEWEPVRTDRSIDVVY